MSTAAATGQQLVVNPKPFLADLTGRLVRVKLKFGGDRMMYQGTLRATDAYMNVLLENAEEYVAGTFAGLLGDVLIRCNNVLYIVAAPAEEQEKAAHKKQKTSA